MDSKMEDSCCVCLDAVPNVRFFPCRHVVSCAGCFLKEKLATGKPAKTASKCPVCRSTVTYYSTTDAHPAIQNILRTHALDLDEDCCAALKAVCVAMIRPNTTVRRAVRAIVEAQHTFSEGFVKPRALLTVAQTEQLLMQARSSFGASEDSYMMINLLVAICQEPWDVDRDVGSHGVCYHGNMGEKPSLITGVDVLFYNHRLILKCLRKRTGFFSPQ
jgi:hypothetical protein